MNLRRSKPLIVVVVMCEAYCGAAQAQLLPQGIGAVQVGYRKYDSQLPYFDANGESHPQSDRISTDFTAPAMASGKAGSDLQKLYQEMKKFESQGTQSGIADEMNFGYLSGDVKTSIDAQFVGVGYGISNKYTVFVGVPFINASVDANLEYGGTNNAAEIKQRLGNLVYKEMQEGLDKAINISAQQIKNNLEVDQGYAPIDHWEYSGVGDIQVAGRTEIKGSTFGLKPFSLGLGAQLDLATGHEDDPDNLVDIPLSRGYHAVTLSSDAVFQQRSFDVGLMTSITQGMNREVMRRVPEGDETLTTADRKTEVHWEPGQDLGAVLHFSAGSALIRGGYLIGTTQHLADRYSGKLEGNYGAMGKASASAKNYQQLSATLSTVESYQRKVFALPLVVKLTMHDTFAGRNANAERYYELSLMSFFQTPAAAAPDKKPDHRQLDKSPRRKSSALAPAH